VGQRDRPTLGAADVRPAPQEIRRNTDGDLG
jgi:hypothetical protein